jgi:CRISPR/Cas system-associated exonuclease Cas4 (RecB family)
MPTVGFKCNQGICTFKECLACQDSCLPKPFLHALIESVEDRTGMISATSITSCLRKTYYEHTVNYYENILNVYVPFRGKVFHSILESYKGEDFLSELRIEREIDGHVISGKFDSYDKVNQILYDYKTSKSCPCVHFPNMTRNSKCARFKPDPLQMKKATERKKPLPACTVINCKNKNNKPYDGHILQMNIYRWIMEANDLPVKKMCVLYMDMSCVRVIECPSKGDIENFIKVRLRSLVECLEDKVLPDAERGWLCDYCHFKGMCNGN